MAERRERTEGREDGRTHCSSSGCAFGAFQYPAKPSRSATSNRTATNVSERRFSWLYHTPLSSQPFSIHIVSTGTETHLCNFTIRHILHRLLPLQLLHPRSPPPKVRALVRHSLLWQGWAWRGRFGAGGARYYDRLRLAFCW